MDLVLSLFTGSGLLDKGFQQTGFCVVSAGDILWGQDVRDFHWLAKSNHSPMAISGSTTAAKLIKSSMASLGGIKTPSRKAPRLCVGCRQ